MPFFYCINNIYFKYAFFRAVCHVTLRLKPPPSAWQGSNTAPTRAPPNMTNSMPRGCSWSLVLLALPEEIQQFPKAAASWSFRVFRSRSVCRHGTLVDDGGAVVSDVASHVERLGLLTERFALGIDETVLHCDAFPFRATPSSQCTQATHVGGTSTFTSWARPLLVSIIKGVEGARVV